MKSLEEQLKTIRDSENRNPMKIDELERIALKIADPQYKKTNKLRSFISRLLPECYTSFTFNNLNFKNFHEETLFFIFYAFPESDLQLQAYNELINKGYLFSKTLNLFVLINEQKVADNKKRTVLAFIPKEWEKSNVDVVFDTPFVQGLESNIPDNF